MPVKDCQLNNKPGFKYGDEGTCYTYDPNYETSKESARKKAQEQGQAIETNNAKKLKISFDYDGVLSTDKGKEIAKEKIYAGNEVFIITARKKESDNSDLYLTAESITIKKDHIYFTEGKDKWPTIKELGIDEHYDNNQEQIDKIKINTKGIKAIKFKLLIYKLLEIINKNNKV